MRRILVTSLIVVGLVVAVGCRAEDKPLPPPNPNSQPQATQPANPEPAAPMPESAPK
jgi:hypothetical protein